MGDRLGIPLCRELFFPCHCPILLKNIELIEKHILLKHTCSGPYRLEKRQLRTPKNPTSLLRGAATYPGQSSFQKPCKNFNRVLQVDSCTLLSWATSTVSPFVARHDQSPEQHIWEVYNRLFHLADSEEPQPSHG